MIVKGNYKTAQKQEEEHGQQQTVTSQKYSYMYFQNLLNP
jgi:hypothetical protein